MCIYNVSGYYQVPWERDTEKFSVMGTLFNPAVREATGSLYKLHTSEIPTNSGADWWRKAIERLNTRYTKFAYLVSDKVGYAENRAEQKH